MILRGNWNTGMWQTWMHAVNLLTWANHNHNAFVWDWICAYFLRGGSGESLGATPRATEARNSCLFCCTRRAALIILWHGVLRYGRLTFWAKSSTTISRSVCWGGDKTWLLPSVWEIMWNSNKKNDFANYIYLTEHINHMRIKQPPGVSDTLVSIFNSLSNSNTLNIQYDKLKNISSVQSPEYQVECENAKSHN